MEPKGLYNKYVVKKVEGETDPEAVYFALRLDTDPAARVAAMVYAELVAASRPELSRDLKNELAMLPPIS